MQLNYRKRLILVVFILAILGAITIFNSCSESENTIEYHLYEYQVAEEYHFQLLMDQVNDSIKN